MPRRATKRSMRYVLVPAYAARDEYREHFSGACRKPNSKRCKSAKRAAYVIARDHIAMYGPSYYKQTKTRRPLRGGDCAGGCK